MTKGTPRPRTRLTAYTLPVVNDDFILVPSREITFYEDDRFDEVGIGGFVVTDWPRSSLGWLLPDGRQFRLTEATLVPNPYGELPADTHTIILWQRIA